MQFALIRGRGNNMTLTDEEITIVRRYEYKSETEQSIPLITPKELIEDARKRVA